MIKNLHSVIVLVVCLVYVSCTLNDPGPSTATFPLTLEASQDFSLIRLNWSPVRVTGFKEYILLQSTSEIPSSPTPVVSAEVTIVKRIDDADITSVVTSDILFSENVCYKLYVSVDDRFIQSNNVCLQQDFKLIEGFYDRAGHENGSDKVVMFDRVNRYISVYSFASEEFISMVSENLLQFPVMDVSTWGDVTHLFAYDQSPGRFIKYNLPSFSPVMQEFFGTVLFAVKSYKQFIFTASEESGSAFKVLNRSSLNTIDSDPGFLGNRNIAVFEGDPLTVLEVGETKINKYNIDGNGKITLVETRSPGVSQLQAQNSTAQGTDYFIAGRQGDIINRDGEIDGSLIKSLNSFVTLSRFSEDEKSVAYVVSDNITIRFEVADISNPSQPVVRASYNLPNATYSDLIVNGNILYLIGVSFATGQAQTFIFKYPMP